MKSLRWLKEGTLECFVILSRFFHLVVFIFFCDRTSSIFTVHVYNFRSIFSFFRGMFHLILYFVTYRCTILFLLDLYFISVYV